MPPLNYAIYTGVTSMSVPAKFNDYGVHVWNQDLPRDVTQQTWNPKTGQTTSSETFYDTRGAQVGGSCERSGHSKQWYKLKAGVPWRETSSYERHGAVYRTLNPGVWDYTFSASNHRMIRGYEGFSESTLTDAYLRPWSGADPLVFARTQANVECMQKLGEQKASFLEDLAEAHRTYREVATLTRTLLLAVKAAKGRDMKSLGRLLGLQKPTKAISGALLSYQYGWRPLMSDIHAGVQLLNGRLNKPLILRAAREVKTNFDEQFPSNWTTAVYNVRLNTNVVNKTILYAVITDSFVHTAQQYGTQDPLGLAWDLIPYSFVVDWAMPIGNVLGALASIRGLTFLDGVTIQRMEGKGQFSRKFGTTGYYPLVEQRVAYELFKTVRTKLTAFPTPMTYFKSPFSHQHVVDVLALLRQRI